MGNLFKNDASVESRPQVHFLPRLSFPVPDFERTWQIARAPGRYATCTLWSLGQGGILEWYMYFR
jgi:hypothetical protein